MASWSGFRGVCTTSAPHAEGVTLTFAHWPGEASASLLPEHSVKVTIGDELNRCPLASQLYGLEHF
jgi:hypothetical protein